MGIEPTRSAWKADVLPLNYARKGTRESLAGPRSGSKRQLGDRAKTEVGSVGSGAGRRSRNGHAGEGRVVGRAGFEPAKAEPSDLQSDPFGRSGISPWSRCPGPNAAACNAADPAPKPKHRYKGGARSQSAPVSSTGCRVSREQTQSTRKGRPEDPARLPLPIEEASRSADPSRVQVVEIAERECWSQRWDSNPQPPDYKSGALPLSHAGHRGGHPWPANESSMRAESSPQGGERSRVSYGPARAGQASWQETRTASKIPRAYGVGRTVSDTFPPPRGGRRRFKAPGVVGRKCQTPPSLLDQSIHERRAKRRRPASPWRHGLTGSVQRNGPCWALRTLDRVAGHSGREAPSIVRGPHLLCARHRSALWLVSIIDPRRAASTLTSMGSPDAYGVSTPPTPLASPRRLCYSTPARTFATCKNYLATSMSPSPRSKTSDNGALRTARVIGWRLELRCHEYEPQGLVSAASGLHKWTQKLRPRTTHLPGLSSSALTIQRRSEKESSTAT